MLRGGLHMRPLPLSFLAGMLATSFYFSPPPVAAPRLPSVAILLGGFLTGWGATASHGDLTTLIVWGLAKPHHLLRPVAAVIATVGAFAVATLAKRALAARCFASSFLPRRAEWLGELCAARGSYLPPQSVPTLAALLLLLAFTAAYLPSRKRAAAGREAANRLRAIHPDMASCGAVAASLLCGALYARGWNAIGLTPAAFRGAVGLGDHWDASPWVFYLAATTTLTLMNAGFLSSAGPAQTPRAHVGP